jgi:hypothetical protein
LARPTKTSEFALKTRKKLQQFVEKNVTFLGEFPSRKSAESNQKIFPKGPQNQTEPYLPKSIREEAPHPALDACTKLINAVAKAKDCLTSLHNLGRRKAAEVLVWLAQNVNRDWNPEMPNSVPIAYALQGYSLSAKTMRSMCNAILQACHAKGCNVVGMAFDGQWIALLSKDSEGQPLTRLQLQKTVWATAIETKKRDIVLAIQDIGKLHESLA